MKFSEEEYTNMRKIAVLFFAAVLIVFAGTAWAQTETGQISGTITDPSGGVVADAKVVVKSVNTGMTRETASNSSGLYTSPSLRPDTYDVTIQFTGFKTFTQRVVVLVGSKVEVSAQLTVGAQVEVVEVTGAPVNAVN